jgi:hypothetical protein
MRVEHRSERCHEQRLKETRLEKQAEEKRVERLSRILAKKAASAKAEDRPAA